MKFFWALLLSLGLSVSALAADPGVTESQILIGQSAPFTGPAAQLGIRLRLGIEAYLKAINAEGGVNGRSIKLISLDDGYEPARTVANTKEFINGDQVFALLGYVGTPTTLAAKPLIDEAKFRSSAPSRAPWPCASRWIATSSTSAPVTTMKPAGWSITFSSSG